MGSCSSEWLELQSCQRGYRGYRSNGHPLELRAVSQASNLRVRPGLEPLFRNVYYLLAYPSTPNLLPSDFQCSYSAIWTCPHAPYMLSFYLPKSKLVSQNKSLSSEAREQGHSDGESIETRQTFLDLCALSGF